MNGYSSGKYPVSVNVIFFVECKIKNVTDVWENCIFLWFYGNE